jgi:AcrR family transcriptional regulator
MAAAMACFAKRGFHQASMHDISEEAGISVGLIYRYFESKDAVISAMVEAHKETIHELLGRAKQANSLLEALEIFFTAHCCPTQRRVQSAFVVDLYAEASRNPRLAKLIRGVLDTLMDAVSELIANAPEMQRLDNGLTAPEIADLIFATLRGLVMRDVIDNSSTEEERRDRQTKALRLLWRMIFGANREPALA